MARELKGRRICKCECGGQVRGFRDFGQLWTWCEQCTPTSKVELPCTWCKTIHTGMCKRLISGGQFD